MRYISSSDPHNWSIVAVSLGAALFPLGRVQGLIASFPELNARWFLTGEGNMIEESAPGQNQITVDSAKWKELQTIQKYSDQLQEHITTLKERIADQQLIIGMLKKK